MRAAVGFQNGIGNFIIYTSVLRALHYHTEHPVDLILDNRWVGESREAINEIASRCPSIANVLDFQADFDPEKYDLFHTTFHGSYGDAFFEFRYKDQRSDPERYTAWAESYLHERDFYYIELANEIGYRGPIFEQHISPSFYNFGYDSSKLNIVISNGFSPTRENVWDKKSYPHWEELILLLKEYYNADFFLVGGKNDLKWARSLSRKVECISLVGETNILETAHVIKECDLLLATDSSCFHLGDALKKDGVVLFGPTLISKNGPLNNTMISIRSPLACAPCQSTIFLKTCSESQKCMDAIDPSLVMAVIRRIVNRSRVLLAKTKGVWQVKG